jgi:hypothetical protein
MHRHALPAIEDFFRGGGASKPARDAYGTPSPDEVDLLEMVSYTQFTD